MEVITNGAIERLHLPDGWSEGKVEQSAGQDNWRAFFKQGQQDVQIALYNHAFPLSKNTVDTFISVVNAGGQASLSAAEISSLSLVFGINTVGNNQYVNQAQLGERNYPPFNLKAAVRHKLQGRNVIAVQGCFQDRQAKILSSYMSLFFLGVAGATAEEIYLKADNESILFQYMPDFEAVLQSIEWRN